MKTFVTCVAAATILTLSAGAQEGGQKPIEEAPAAVKPGSGENPGGQIAPVVAPSDADIARRSAQETGTGGNSWFPVTVRELGTFYGQGEAVGQFEFQNPQDAEIEWRALDPSCQCAAAEIRFEDDRVYRVIAKPEKRLVRVIKRDGQPDKLENVRSITVGAKEKGVIETRLDMHNIVGPKSATLMIHSTDPEEPQSLLTFRATGAQLFTVSPKEVNLNKMTWNETREFSVTVASGRVPDWKILRMDDAGEAFDVSWEKLEVGAGLPTTYKISGKYSPDGATPQSGGVLKFHTDINGAATFSVRVLAFVQGPLEVKPGAFLSLGLIRRGQAASKEVVFEPNDTTDLEATELLFEQVTLGSEFLTAVPRKDGKNLVVELQVAENAPTGLLKGELVVKLNHPLVPEKRITFNGFVR